MSTFTISLAGVKVGVTSLYEEVRKLCADYLCDGKPDFTVSVTQPDLEFERVRSFQEALLEKRPLENFPDSYLETLAVYRKIAVEVLHHDAFLMHGSVLCVDGNGYMFTASSGVGKTTHTRLWLENIPGAFVVNGDKPLLRRREGRFEVCGTPWAGKEGMNTNVIVPLRAVCILNRGKENRIDEIPFCAALPVLLQQSYRPSDPAAMLKTMELIKSMNGAVKFYNLYCNMDPEAALVAYAGMNRE